MLFLSPGIVYWVQTLLHWCDSNATFVVDVSRAYANSSSEDGKNKIKAYIHTAFRTVARKFSIGGLCSSVGGLDIIKLTKIPLIYSVSCFNLGGNCSFVLGG